MSFNQSSSDKSEIQCRKSWRSAASNQQRSSLGAYDMGAGGGPAPSPFLSPSSSLPSNRSSKKSNNNGQGGQFRVNSPAVNSSDSTNASAARNAQNGAHVRPQLQGAPDSPIAASNVAKPVESPANQRSARAFPKAPTAQSTTMTSNNARPAVPAKGDTSKAFPSQFGTIIVEGMQSPGRTSLAPRNLNEQKRDQAHHDFAFRSVPNLPTPVPKQLLPRKDSAATDQSYARETHPIPKIKKDAQTPPAPSANQTQKPSVITMPMSSMQMPHFHQTQVSMQFSGPNSPIQPQATSLRIPMHTPLPIGNPPQVQQKVFVQGLQAHTIPPQGMIHQGQGLGFPQPWACSQGMIERNSSDRWLHAAIYLQKGLIPSPQTPSRMMHKAEKKYEVGKVSDEEEAKQRQLKAILNKLTPQNFDELFEQVKAVNIDNVVTLIGVVSQIFDKALMEPTFCEMYANFCYHLAGALPDFIEDNEKITFKRLLINKCQMEFERGEKEQEEATEVEEGEVKQSEEEREEKRIKAQRQRLGTIRLIGELYKEKMLTERIMHECILRLLGQYQNPDEEDVEALCILMSSIGEMIDHPKAKEHMDAYFDRMAKLSNNMKLSSKVRFMLKDAIDLRKNKWQQRRKVEGPKKIGEVQRYAAQKREAQAGWLDHGPGINPVARRDPSDFGPRGSAMLSSPGAQMGSFRGLSSQVRGFGSQDVCMEDRQSFEARTSSVPLPQRQVADDSITLGPQGGLARGMSFRGLPAMPSNPISDIFASPRDSRRALAGLNGFNSVSERSTLGSREDLAARYAPDRFAGSATYDQLSSQERNISYGNRDLRNPDHNFDRPQGVSPPT